MQGRAMKENATDCNRQYLQYWYAGIQKGATGVAPSARPDTFPFIARSQTDSSIRGCRVVANHECPLRFEFTTSRAHIE